MQHMTGNIGQSVRHDYGDFIKVGSFSIRLEQIIFYAPIYINEEPTPETAPLLPGNYGIRMSIAGYGQIAIPISNDLSVVKKEIERLDWLFKKGNPA